MENQTEFDLNRALAAWRQQLGQSPAYREENLEELESHLRDSIAPLAGRGLTEEEAFLIATRRVGAPRALEPEFAKVNGRDVWLGRLLWMLVGIQAWTLMGRLSTVLSQTGVHLLMANFPGLYRGVEAAGPGIGTAPALASLPLTALSFVADLVALSAIVTACWWLFRRVGDRLSRLLRRPRWVTWSAGGLCIAVFLCSALDWLGRAVMVQSFYPEDYGRIAYALAVASLPLFFFKTVALAGLTVLLARWQLRRTSA